METPPGPSGPPPAPPRRPTPLQGVAWRVVDGNYSAPFDRLPPTAEVEAEVERLRSVGERPLERYLTRLQLTCDAARGTALPHHAREPHNANAVRALVASERARLDGERRALAPGAEGTRGDLQATSPEARGYFWAVYDALPDLGARDGLTLADVWDTAARGTGHRAPGERGKKANSARMVFRKNGWHSPHTDPADLLAHVEAVGYPFDRKG